MNKPNYECDLHTHTNRSDGADTPAELIENAAAVGMKVIAMTDHDVRPPEKIQVGGTMVDAVAYARSRGLILLRGTEISCETEVEDVHIVCLGCDWTDAFFDKLEQDVPRSKIEAYRALTEALTQNGMPVRWEEVLENNGHPVDEQSVQKKMIFELLARKGYVKDWQTAKLLVKSTPAFQIKRRKPDALYVIREVKRMGGICILAHPYLIADTVKTGGRTMSRDQFIDCLIEAGLDGIEVRYTYDKTSYGGSLTKEEIAQEVLQKYGNRLPILSGGSDYHADHKKGVANARQIGEAGINCEEFFRNALLAHLAPSKAEP